MNLELPKETLSCQNFCSGQWVKASGAAFTVTSPYTNEVVGESFASTAADLEKIIAGAEAGFQIWRNTPLKERCGVLFNLREILLRDKIIIANRVAIESGKTLPEAAAGLMKGIEVLEFALSLQNMDHGGRMEVSRGVTCEYHREPLGIVAGITPFNFPAMVPMWMLPIAIVTGNAFIWKPSDKTPLTSILIADAFKEAGLPDGVLSVLQGGKESVEAILDHEKIKAIGFVGSTSVAKAVYRRGTHNLKRVLALGGAKNHIVLLPDADKNLTGAGIAASFIGCAGQRCMAASALLAVGDSDHLIDEIVIAAKNTKLGPDMGAIINAESLKLLESAIDQAEKDGATVLLDGRKKSVPDKYSKGYWLAPTILDHVKPGSQAATKELFGPVLSIIRCKNISEALTIENSNEYGNACSVFTQDGGAAQHVAKQARAGMIGVNIGVPVPREPFSFGGFYESRFGNGDITGPAGVDFWTQQKKLTAKWAQQSDDNWMS